MPWMTHDHLNTAGSGAAKASKRDVLPLPGERFPVVTHNHGPPPARRPGAAAAGAPGGLATEEAWLGATTSRSREPA